MIRVAPKVAPFFIRCATGGGITRLGRIEKSVGFCKPKLRHSHLCPARGGHNGCDPTTCIFTLRPSNLMPRRVSAFKVSPTPTHPIKTES